jgi:hypothetical protein
MIQGRGPCINGRSSGVDSHHLLDITHLQTGVHTDVLIGLEHDAPALILAETGMFHS